MAIYHFNVQVIGRAQGRSAVAAAAYRAADRLHDERLDRDHDFRAKSGVEHSEIMLPEGAPEQWRDRERLWNDVEAFEKRKDAQLAREVEFAIPREMTKAQGIELARDFVQAEFVDRGMIADLNVHWDIGADGMAKPHAHVMLMDTSFPAVTPQDQPPAANPAEAAFAELSAKVDFLETLLRGLVAKREAMPDYSETLGEIAALLEKMRTAIKTLAARPAMTLSPDAMAAQIAAAGAKARAEDRATIQQAGDRIDKAAARMEHLAGTVATVREQRRHLLWVAIGGLLAGILLWSFLPGMIARAMPESWHWPERMAARTLDLDRWTAGERLLSTSEPERWRTVLFSNALVQENRDAIGKCRETAAKAKKPVRCSVEIRS
jgi:hypothetical protein